MIHFDLPPHLIAQHPCEKRDQSRLLVVRRDTAQLTGRKFSDLPDLLSPRDLLVLNDTRVLPARMYGRRKKTGGKWEGLFLRSFADGDWEILSQTRGRLVAGEEVLIEPGPLTLQFVEKQANGSWKVKPSETGAIPEIMSRHGHIPLPPYIRKGIASEEDTDRYQTVFARQPGAVAAPTAGLHFTPEVMDRLKQRGINISYLTLHVGWGTFQPLKVADYSQHKMHSEWGEVKQPTIDLIADCLAHHGKVIAVGTTSVRVLETVAAKGKLKPWSGETDLFIHPPYDFKIVNAMITNFHLPETTLLLLVGAFTGESLLEKAYETAIAKEFRFYSYGDAMLIL